jgi:general stress protein YciG
MVNKEERRQYAAALGKQGGKARAKAMSPEERSEAARKAVQARWNKARAAARRKP